jgi:Putative restriction endonuclease
MAMVTAAQWVDDDDRCFDPDDLKMPESPEHRRVIDAVGIVASRLLGPDVVVYRDMNWYPNDGGNAVAPDLMVLAAIASVQKSYRQPVNGPLPSVVVEVPSASDGFTDFLQKAARYQRLGVCCYSVITDAGACAVFRFMPGEGAAYTVWTGEPIPELGGLRIDVANDRIIVITPTGDVLVHDGDLVEANEQRTIAADRRTTEAELRVSELEARLRAAGIEP